jgi:hypothetical protein
MRKHTVDKAHYQFATTIMVGETVRASGAGRPVAYFVELTIHSSMLSVN